MAGKFKLPKSLDPTKKVFITPRTGVVVGIAIGANHAKSALMKSQVTALDNIPNINLVKSQMLGTPVVDQFIIKREIDTLTNFFPQTSPNYAKFDAATIVINQTRNIVKTPIQGRNGSVLEYISDDNYEINVKAIMCGLDPDTAPLTELEQLLGLLTEPNELVLSCDFLTTFSIQYAVPMSYTVTQIEGSVNQIQIDMRFISDEALELKLGIDPNA